MHPWLLRWGDVGIPTYFAVIALGLAIATFVVRREARREGLGTRDVFDLALIVGPAGAVGARAMVIFDDPPAYLANPALFLGPQGGWTSYGGFLGVVVGITLGARFKGLDPWRIVDVFSPAIMFGYAFARTGCLASGCCHGRPADWPLGVEVPWAVRYHIEGRVPDALLAVPLHPSPVYESLLALGLFVLVTRLRARRRYPGQMFAGLLVAYGLGRFALEPLRGDLERGFVLGGHVSVAQVLATSFVAAGLLLHAWRRRSCSPS